MDEKSIENGLEGQKFLVVCLFWGGCHHPNLRLLSLNTGKIFVLQQLRNFYQCDGSMIEFISCDGLLQSMVESFIYSSTFAIVYFIAVRFCGGRSLTVASLS